MCSAVPPLMPFSISSTPLLSPLPTLPEVPFCCSCFLQRVNTIPMPRSRGREKELLLLHATFWNGFIYAFGVIHSCSTLRLGFIVLNWQYTQLTPCCTVSHETVTNTSTSRQPPTFRRSLPALFPHKGLFLPLASPPPHPCSPTKAPLTCSYIVELLKCHQHICKVPLLIQQVGWLENL